MFDLEVSDKNVYCSTKHVSQFGTQTSAHLCHSHSEEPLDGHSVTAVVKGQTMTRGPGGEPVTVQGRVDVQGESRVQGHEGRRTHSKQRVGQHVLQVKENV